MYPTERLWSVVVVFFVYILRFLVRARDWYEEGRIKHFIHSITRPWELRYDDIVENIARRTQVVKDLAVSGQQAEFRDTNQKRDSEFKEIQERFEKANRKLEEISTALAGEYTVPIPYHAVLAPMLGISGGPGGGAGRGRASQQVW